MVQQLTEISCFREFVRYFAFWQAFDVETPPSLVDYVILWLTDDKVSGQKMKWFVSCLVQKLTEGRVVSCNHDLVPDYLRTKPEPEVEEKINIIANKAANVNHDTATVSTDWLWFIKLVSDVFQPW